MVGIYVEKAQFKTILLAESTSIHFFKKHVTVFSYGNKDLKYLLRNTRWKLTAVLKKLRHIFDFTMIFLCYNYANEFWKVL